MKIVIRGPEVSILDTFNRSSAQNNSVVKRTRRIDDAVLRGIQRHTDGKDQNRNNLKDYGAASMRPDRSKPSFILQERQALLGSKCQAVSVHLQIKYNGRSMGELPRKNKSANVRCCGYFLPLWNGEDAEVILRRNLPSPAQHAPLILCPTVCFAN